jgi:hypothetical protein
MSDTNGGATVPNVAGVGDLSRFDKFFSTPVAQQPLVEPAPAPEVPAQSASKPEPIPDPKAPEGQAAPEEKAQAISLAEKIRQDREAKAAQANRQVEEQSYRTRYEQAEAKLAKLSKTDIVADPLGWAELQELTREEQAALGETLLYGLVPDKATPEVRIKLIEQRTARKEKLAAQEKQAEEQARMTAEAQKVHEQYIDALASSVEALPPGAFPNSEDWFGGDQLEYVNALYSVANRLANEAAAEGKQADLRFEAVAKVLERQFESRLTRVRAKVGKTVAPEQKPNDLAADKQTAETPIVISTKGMGGGAPRPPATTEAERIARATEAAFRAR